MKTAVLFSLFLAGSTFAMPQAGHTAAVSSRDPKVDGNNSLPSTTVKLTECMRIYRPHREEYEKCLGKPGADRNTCKPYIVQAAVDTTGCAADTLRPSGVDDDVHKKCRDEATREATGHVPTLVASENGGKDVTKFNLGMGHSVKKTYSECVRAGNITR